jgi:hypothetical protein
MQALWGYVKAAASVRAFRLARRQVSVGIDRTTAKENLRIAMHPRSGADIDAWQELSDVLDEIKALRGRLESRSPPDTAAVDSELDRLAGRLRDSEQKLKARKPLDVRAAIQPRERRIP